MSAINVNSSCSMKFIAFLTFVVLGMETFNFCFVLFLAMKRILLYKFIGLRIRTKIKSHNAYKFFLKIFICAFVEPIDILLLKKRGINKNHIRRGLPFLGIILNGLFYYDKLNNPKASTH